MSKEEGIKILLMEELAEVLCGSCPLTEFGTIAVNTSPHNLCEGTRCEEAYENWISDNVE